MEYKELDVWIAGRKLVKEVYEISKSFPKEDQFGITNQIRRCAIYIPSNIAEGCGRRSYNESLRFFYIARGSLYELETQFYLAADVGFISQTKLGSVTTSTEICKKILNGFINYYKSLIGKIN